jgi:hypothetical protein
MRDDVYLRGPLAFLGPMFPLAEARYHSIWFSEEKGSPNLWVEDFEMYFWNILHLLAWRHPSFISTCVTLSPIGSFFIPSPYCSSSQNLQTATNCGELCHKRHTDDQDPVWAHCLFLGMQGNLRKRSRLDEDQGIGSKKQMWPTISSLGRIKRDSHD